MGSGICSAAAVRNGMDLKTKIVGVAAEGAPAYALSFEAGRVIEAVVTTQIADGMACRTPDPDAVAIIQENVHHMVRVTDTEIRRAMKIYFTATHNLIEGAGAASLAAALKEKELLLGKRVGLVATGGNVDHDVFARVLMEEEALTRLPHRNRVPLSGWCPMRLAFSLVAVCCLLFTLATSAAAQAAAESALTHALSSSTGSAVGKALGNATGQLAGKLGQQTSNAVSPKKVSSIKLGSSAVAKVPVTPNAGPSASGSLIASVQGAVLPPPSCTPAKAVDSNQPKTEVAVPKPSVPAGTPNCDSSPSQEGESHPAVVNLPAAK